VSVDAQDFLDAVTTPPDTSIATEMLNAAARCLNLVDDEMLRNLNERQAEITIKFLREAIERVQAARC